MVSMNELTFGVEIETIGNRQKIAHAITTVVGGTYYQQLDCYQTVQVVDRLGRVWKVMRDSSIHPRAEMQAEVVTPILTLADMDELQEVIRAVRKVGKAKVSNSCGIHIHVGASAFSGKALVNLTSLVYSHESFIFKALGVRDNRTALYAKPVEERFVNAVKREKAETLGKLEELWYPLNSGSNKNNHYDYSRYHGLNLHAVFSKGTVEFRYFNSTLHAGEVKAYVMFVLAMACYAINKRSVVAKQKAVVPTCERFDFRCLLIHLGLNGEEFKNVREHLLKLLGGSNSRAVGRTC